MASFADYVKDLMGVLPQVNGNPMLSVTSMTDDNARYREDPFYRSREIQARDQLVLDEEERRRREAALSGSGMMGGGGGDSGVDGRNYYTEREAELRAANLPEDEVQSILRAEQEANNARLASGLNLFANAFVPGMGLFNAAKYGQALPDYLQGNLRTMIGDSGGYQSPFAPKAAGAAAPVVSGSGGTTYSPSALQEMLNITGGTLTPQQAQAVVNYNSGGDSSGGSVGYGGQDGMGGQADSALTGYTE
jgi:hypothetical protein